MKLDEHEVRESGGAYRSLIQHASDLILVADEDGVIRYASHAAGRILGRDAGELVGATPFDLFHPDDMERVAASFAEKMGLPGRDTPIECRARHRDGSWRWLEATTTNLLDDPDVRGMVINARDISERKSLGDQLAFQALHDELTGLPNRALLSDRLDQALERRERSRSQIAVVLLDLDGFKEINDSMGHHAGDELLIRVAERLQLAVRPEDTVARLGGDEFVLVCDVADGDDAMLVAERISAAFDGPFELSAGSVPVTASIGFTVTDHPSESADKLLRDADVAMYRAKKLGRNRHVAADPTLRASIAQRVRVEGSLRGAVAEGQLRVLYQPIVRLDDERIVGAEALVRWAHPEFGWMLPGDFIGSAEHTGLIVPIGNWMLERACARGAEWVAARRDDAMFRVSVNISARELAEPGFAETVARILADTRLPAGALSLEMTERALMRNPEAARSWLDPLLQLGVHLVIDDFGGGHSTIRHLKRLPISGLKVPAGAAGDLVDRAIVRGVLEVADALGSEVIAEGVETPDQESQLAELGCRYAQGYHFARPQSPEEFMRLLATERLGL
ncbi:MAG TPA: EAL domain-containing protein [Egibacteraceae bacterium]|nr:EAL domain-containing protein [Egibacteraceae bacterium]